MGTNPVYKKDIGVQSFLAFSDHHNECGTFKNVNLNSNAWRWAG